jgi:hypothetical protein
MHWILLAGFVTALSAGSALAQVVPAPVAKPTDTQKNSDSLKQGEELKALADCEQLWEPATHMSRQDWTRTCRRVHERFRQLDLR